MNPECNKFFNFGQKVIMFRASSHIGLVIAFWVSYYILGHCYISGSNKAQKCIHMIKEAA